MAQCGGACSLGYGQLGCRRGGVGRKRGRGRERSGSRAGLHGVFAGRQSLGARLGLLVRPGRRARGAHRREADERDPATAVLGTRAVAGLCPSWSLCGDGGRGWQWRASCGGRGKRATRGLGEGNRVAASRWALGRGREPGRGAGPRRAEACRRRVGAYPRARPRGHEAAQGGVRSARNPQSRALRRRAVSMAAAGTSAFDASDAPSMDGLRACVHCGICLPQCPTYRVLGEEMASPRGRIYLMRAAAEGRIDLTPTLARHLDLCLGCRGCETACPSGVPFGQLLEATRAQLVRKGVRAPESDHATTRWALETFPHPARLAPLLWGLRLYQASGAQALVRAFGILAPFRKLKAMESLLPDVASSAPLPAFIPARGEARGRAGLLTGCVQRFFYADVNARTARLLSAAGWD